MKYKFLSLLMACALLICLMAGCSGTAAPESSEAPAQASQEAPETPAVEEPAQAEPEEEEPQEATVAYPLEGDGLELSFFTSFPGNLASYLESFDAHPGFQMAQEKTGVKINFTAPSMETSSTQFDLMVASDEFTDIVGGFDSLYVGGLTSAYEGELIYDVASYLDSCAPDYLRVVNSNDTYQNLVYEADGTSLAVYGLYLYDYTSVSNGIFIRQDWLDDLGMDAPETYDDWHETLTAFKTEKGASAPLLLPVGSESRGATYSGGFLTSGYSTEAKMSGGHFFQVDGKVTSSLIDSKYKDYLTMLHDWFAEGLIYNDYYSQTRDTAEQLLLGDQMGIFDGKVDFITKFNGKDANGVLRLSGIQNPMMNKGEISGFGSYVTEKSSFAITSSCQNVELALNWLNYFFTEEGILLCNYGQEDVTYTYDQDGQPQFTDIILHNEDPQLQFGNVTRLYLLDEVLPTVYDQTRELAAYNDAERDAIQLWTDTKEAKYTLPTVTLSTEANEELSMLLVDIETYASECVTKFIIGDMSLDKWDEFVSTMESLGIHRCIEIYQEAIDAL